MINSQPYVTPLAGLFIGGVLPAALGSLIRKRSWLYEKKNKERERASKLPRGVGRVGPKFTSLKKNKNG